MIYCEVLADVPLYCLGHGLIDTACAETSAERKYRKVVVESEFFSRFRAAYAVFDIAPYRQTGDGVLEFAAVHEIQGFLYREHYMIDLF